MDGIKIPVEKCHWYTLVILYFRTDLYAQVREDVFIYVVRSLKSLSLHSREDVE